MIFAYEGTDITELVSLERCVYEARDDGRAPFLSVEVEDDAGLWDRWSPQPGDRVEVSEDGSCPTGAMYVERAEPYSGGYALYATALPTPDARTTREWRDTTLLTVARQLAGELGLSVAAHGVDDMGISYARQPDGFALPLLARLAALGGCTIDVHDGVLHLAGREWAEGQQAAGALSLGDGSEYSYSRRAGFSSCELTQPAGHGLARMAESHGSGSLRFSAELSGDVAFPGSAELRRACAGVLARENAGRSLGYAVAEELSPFSPGAVCTVECEKTPSLSGRGIVTRVRNDFSEGTSKTWWRQI